MSVIATKHPLPEKARRRGLLAILILQFFAFAGFFIVIPLVAVHYVENLGWTAGAVGVVLAARMFLQQSITVFCGALADKIGPRPLIAIGMLGRAAGFAWIGYAESFPMVLTAMIVAGLGGAFFEAPRSAAIAYLTLPEERPRFYAIAGVIGSVGLAGGTQLGGLLINVDFRTVCIVAAFVYIGLFFVIMGMLPSIKLREGSSFPFSAMRRPFADRTFMLYVGLLCGNWFANVQFSLTVTLAAVAITGSDGIIAWLYAVSTIVTVAFGYTLPRYLERWFRPVDVLTIGSLALAVGLMMVGFVTTTFWLLMAAAVMSLGSAIAQPGQETVKANLAMPDVRGTYFGVASLSLAVGGGLGNLLGGVAYGFGEDHDAQKLVWTGFALVSLLSAFGFAFFRDRFSQIRDTHYAQPDVIESGSIPVATTRQS